MPFVKSFESFKSVNQFIQGRSDNRHPNCRRRQTTPSELGIRRAFTRLTAVVCQGLECTTVWKEESSSATLNDFQSVSEDDIVRRRPRFAVCSCSWISWKKPGELQSNWVVLGVIPDPARKLPTGTVCICWEISVFNSRYSGN